MPIAAGPYVPDAFSNTNNGRGIQWGLSHVTNASGDWNRNHSILLRFDCDLSLDLHDPEMKKHSTYYAPDFYYQHGLSKKQMERIRSN